MARALIVGCGCRGRLLGSRLIARQWHVRGTTRSDSSLVEIEATGIEAVLADPNLVGSIVEQIEAVTVVVWLMGSASGTGEESAAAELNGPRLESLLEKLVDSPVRGFVYEGAGSAGDDVLAAGAALVTAASERWRIPVEIVTAPPQSPDAWLEAVDSAIDRVLSA